MLRHYENIEYAEVGSSSLASSLLLVSSPIKQRPIDLLYEISFNKIKRDWDDKELFNVNSNSRDFPSLIILLYLVS